MTDTMAPAEPARQAPQQPAPTPNGFVNASAEHIEPAYDSGQIALGSTLSNIEVPANGYLAGILLQVDVVSSGNSANVAVQPDAPWNILKEVRLTDINGANIIGPLNGFGLLLANTFGAYGANLDWASHPAYVAPVVGTGDTGGTMSYMLRIPVQINPRDAFGALPNMNAASQFKLHFTINDAATIFATAPNGTTTVRIRAGLENWLTPAAVAPNGVPNMQAPPSLGTFQRWVSQIFPMVQGSNTFRLQNVGNMIRTLAFVVRDADGARVAAGFPDTYDLRVDGYSRDQIRDLEALHRMWEHYDLPASKFPAGVRVWDFTHELDGKAGFETNELWFATNSATRLELVGDFPQGGTLEVLTNDVIVTG